jgi:hypothetical protein
MTDYKQLCAELTEYLSLLDDPPHELVVRAQFALAEPEPEGPTDEELDELFVHVDQSGEPESWRTYARAVLARWGK